MQLCTFPYNSVRIINFQIIYKDVINFMINLNKIIALIENRVKLH